MSRALILGGTTEARVLCALLGKANVPALVSLAGRVAPITRYGVPARTGGFGGAEGLAGFVRDQGIAAILDATHPFAARMPTHAARAAALTGVPHAMLKRPKWCAGPGDRWHHVADLAGAAATLPRGARAFLATGAGSLAAFARRDDCTLTLRQMTPPDAAPTHVQLLQARPGDLAEETALFRDLGLTHLVCKNSGGPTGAKLSAARALRLPVVLVARPALPSGRVFDTPGAAFDWLRSQT